MKIAVVTFYNKNYSELGNLTTKVMKEYCEHHGYDFICSMDESLYEGRTPLWAKIPLLKKNLANYDWLVWIDSDAMPVNFSYKLEGFIDEKYCAVLAHEHHTDDAGTCINTGIFFIKNCGYSEALLNGTWGETQCISHPWGEQQGMIEFLEKYPNIDEAIKKLEVHPINVKPQNFGPTDFIMHIAGGPANPARKVEIVKAFQKSVGFYETQR